MKEIAQKENGAMPAEEADRQVMDDLFDDQEQSRDTHRIKEVPYIRKGKFSPEMYRRQQYVRTGG